MKKWVSYLKKERKKEKIFKHMVLGRRWVIKLLVQKGYTVEEILKKESELVERIAEVQGPAYY